MLKQKSLILVSSLIGALESGHEIWMAEAV